MLTYRPILFNKKRLPAVARNLVIIPTYNEKENIERMIQSVFSLSVPFDLLIVDDGSPDGTAGIVRQSQEVYPDRLHLIVRPKKSGLGTAYIRGFEWGLEQGYQFLFEMDCDFSHNPNDLVRLSRVLKEKRGDVAIGSRYVAGGQLKNWPAVRKFISRGASVYVQAIARMSIKDPTAGFVGYHRKVLENLDFQKIRFVGYAFQIEMKFAAVQMGFQLCEIPITFTDRIEGVSKMSGGIVKEAIWGVLKMKCKSYFVPYGVPNHIRHLQYPSVASALSRVNIKKHFF